MPTTRRQAAQRNGTVPRDASPPKAASRARKASTRKNARTKDGPQTAIGERREQEESEVKAEQQEEEEPPAKKSKTEADEDEPSHGKTGGDESVKQESDSTQSDGKEDHPAKHTYQTGTIERGHIYFFYRPKVELEEAHSVDDVQRFYILLIPRPPEFSTASDQPNGSKATDEDQEMTVLSEGADAVPAQEPKGQTKKHFRLIIPGKKSLPDPEHGRGRGNIFWGTTVTIGEDLKKLQEGLGEKEYETKTRGTRHQAAARLAARGAYAIVNKEARTPSSRETHLGYHLSDPTSEDWGEVQAALGLHPASSFVLQVKNPLAPPTGSGRVGLPRSRTVDYPEYIMTEVFGKGGGRGREEFGLRFSSVERKEMLDYEGVELLFIAARSGESGLETSLGEGRGKGEVEEEEGREAVEEVFKELAMDVGKIPADPLGGQWA
ncbi:uncharacterized protein B0H18DRAFT_950258 [Fomitopsis serialis]|uniref:uncharacterized protein n=1 Tax=Fomitopsis serialis TaxID=139415 RepID=UPI002007F18C|nr:uncharacterized protein B0H18DRAFT_950258 [Neoantrodia serialis]KAH9937382.1 hypothetical protein B0H18DRAFT_950258 [Neoantrodia serialis]